MRFEHDDMVIWYGTDDTPAPTGSVTPGRELTVTVAVQPVSASHQVELHYRCQSQGTIE